MEKSPCVYMLASKRNGTLYIGVTSNLPRRIAQHKSGQVEGFSKKYGVNTLVWYEPHATMESAIIREKRMKKVEPRLENPPDHARQPRVA